MKPTFLAAILALVPAVYAQVPGSGGGTFGGPAILTNGIGTVGQRSGEDVDLRLYASAVGVYDTGLAPFAVDSSGKLVQPEGQAGTELTLGAYGRHSFRRSVFGVDYNGNYRYYPNIRGYNGTNQQVGVQYTVQKSRRLLFDFRADGSSQVFGTAFGPSFGSDGAFDSNSLLFDNRTNYLNGSVTANYALSNRTMITMNGTGYTVRREAASLADVNGYTASGGIRHQVNRRTIIGATYQHIHYGYSQTFGQSDVELYSGLLMHTFGRRFTVQLSGGLYTSAVKGVQNTAVDPAIAALLGVGSIQTAFYKENNLPMAEARLSYQFRRSVLNGGYTLSINAGNGVYLTSRQEGFFAGYSYTGFRRFSLSILGDVSNMKSLGQTIQAYRQANGMATINYHLGKGLNLTGGYGRRFQDIQGNVYRQNSSRVMFGLSYSPSNIPISFH